MSVLFESYEIDFKKKITMINNTFRQFNQLKQSEREESLKRLKEMNLELRKIFNEMNEDVNKSDR